MWGGRPVIHLLVRLGCHDVECCVWKERERKEREGEREGEKREGEGEKREGERERRGRKREVQAMAARKEMEHGYTHSRVYLRKLDKGNVKTVVAAYDELSIFF